MTVPLSAPLSPTLFNGISSSLTLGRWDFFVSLQGSQGNEVYNKLRRHLVESEGASRGRNRSAELLNAWTTTNHTSTPALGEVVSSAYVYSRFIEDGSFLKLRNLSAGYTLPVRCGQQAFKLRLFASATKPAHQHPLQRVRPRSKRRC
jgi:hypothetical protein